MDPLVTPPRWMPGVGNGRRCRWLSALLSGGVLLAAGVACGPEATSDVVVSGHVEATQVSLSTKIGGTLRAFRLQEGDAVGAGVEVARMDTADLELELATARAERDLAQAELRLLLAGSRQEEIAEAEAVVERAAADLRGAERDLQRFQGLLESGSGTEKARDDALARRDQARATLEAARQRLLKLRAGNRAEQIEVAGARVEAAETRMAQIAQHILDATIVSPASGVVTEKLVEEGELLSPGATLAVVTDLSRPWLTIYVDEPMLGGLRLGEPVAVVTDGGERRTGRVSFIASEAEFTPKNVQTRDERVKLVYRVKVSLDNDDRLFKPGMPAEAHLQVGPGGPS